jgi:hypothetical protein
MFSYQHADDYDTVLIGDEDSLDETKIMPTHEHNEEDIQYVLLCLFVCLFVWFVSLVCLVWFGWLHLGH